MNTSSVLSRESLPSCDNPIEHLRRYGVLVFGVLFVVMPLFPQMSSVETAFVFRSGVFLFAACIIGVYGWKTVWLGLYRHPMYLPSAALILFALAGCAYAPDLYRAKAQWAMGVSLLVFFFVMRFLAVDETALRRLLGALLSGGMLCALHAFYRQWDGHAAALQSLQDYHIYDPVMQQELIKTLEANRAMGAFGNPNHLAGYLVLCLWAEWYLFYRSQHTAIRCALVLCGCWLLFMIYQTYSRSGLAVLLVSLSAFVVFGLFRQRRIRLKWIILFAAVSIGCVGLGIYEFQDSLLGGRLWVNSTILARLHFFRGGWLIIQEHPWFGIGTAGFEAYYSALLRPGDIEARYVHNIFLETALQWGVTGSAAFGWFCFSYIRLCWKALNTPSFPLNAFAGFGSAVSLLLFSLVDFHNHLIEMYLIPVFFAAVTVPSPTACSAELSAQPMTCIQPLTWVTLGTVFLLWIGLIFCPFLNGMFRERGYYYSLDQQYSRARDWYQRAVYVDPTDAESWNHLGHLAKLNPAPHSPYFQLQYMENAVYWSPRRASFRADYAEALFANGQSGRAEMEMRRALEIFPAKPVYAERLASLYEALGQAEKAEEQRQHAERLKQQIEENKL